MFLAKRGSTYYLFFRDAQGKRHKRTTGARTKAEAMHFLKAFEAASDARLRAIQHVTLKDFNASLLTYSASVHTRKTVEANRTALNELERFVGPNASSQASRLPTANGSLPRRLPKRHRGQPGNTTSLLVRLSNVRACGDTSQKIRGGA